MTDFNNFVERAVEQAREKIMEDIRRKMTERMKQPNELLGSGEIMITALRMYVASASQRQPMTATLKREFDEDQGVVNQLMARLRGHREPVPIDWARASSIVPRALLSYARAPSVGARDSTTALNLITEIQRAQYRRSSNPGRSW